MRSKLLTDVLDLLGLLALVAAAAIAVSAYTLAGAVAVGGGGVLAVSWLIDRPNRRPRSGGDR